MKNNPKKCPQCQKQAFLFIIKEKGKEERINTACPVCSMVHDDAKGWILYPFITK
jgi:endogenous inhibitor of DNA gyrase (YacG/DUF329 family)